MANAQSRLKISQIECVSMLSVVRFKTYQNKINRMKRKYIKPTIVVRQTNFKVYTICTSITATAPDMPSGQPCGCDCPCDNSIYGCSCDGCSPNDPCIFFGGDCQ